MLTRFERACGVEGLSAGTTNTASSKGMGRGDGERPIANSAKHGRITVYVARFCIRKIGSLSTFSVHQHHEPTFDKDKQISAIIIVKGLVFIQCLQLLTSVAGDINISSENSTIYEGHSKIVPQSLPGLHCVTG